MKINEVLQTGREALSRCGVEPREARLLLAFAMKIKKDELIKYNECSDTQYDEFLELIRRRCNNEPYAYIVGEKEFMRLNFKVDSNVLIPREDTEILVQEVIEVANLKLESEDKIKILDMCTGSGCIAISLDKYIKKAEITAIDISEKALKLAKENAKFNGVSVNFIKSNLFEKLNTKEKFDIIVSNPPYIRKALIRELQEEVKKEPIIALDGGESGLDFYEIITKLSPKYLNTDGVLAFEIGFDQAGKVSKLMEKNGFKDIKVIKDIEKNNRVVIGNL